ncbi:MAG: DUF1015 domain-containing protein [Spirochaetaceae bacterium]|jgi:hypothetical protein|nr:DUF1015 domain-containing protein [Spirochaetaceae bacterium]
MDIHKRLAALGTAIPRLLLPREGTDLSRWAVIACDQFTQDRSYWERAAAAAGDGPSALHCIFPEVFLDDPGRTERIGRIHQTMKKYLAESLFNSYRACMYVERDTAYHRGRRGLVVCLDLERYDWSADSKPLIRPTEGTVPERLPPRMDARRGAALELPHILVLIDDETDELLRTLGDRVRTGTPLYDTPLMLDSGRVKGWLLDREEDWNYLAGGLEKLISPPRIPHAQDAGGRPRPDQSPPPAERAGNSPEGSGKFLYAVGDGNHSLAAAKAVWEEYKKTGGTSEGPRWVMAELENLYDPALAFEPIHRFIFGAGTEEIKKLLAPLAGFSLTRLSGTGAREKLLFLVKEQVPRTRFGIIAGVPGAAPEEAGIFLVEADPLPLALERIQPLLDGFVKDRPGLSIDYIHGGEELFHLARGSAGTGILLPPFNKRELFRTVAARGPLPRKSFSMGEAGEKRFYLECRKLFE